MQRKSHIRASRFKFKGLIKKLLVLFLICAIIKTAISCGGEKAADALFHSLAEESSAIAIIDSELGTSQKSFSPVSLFSSELGDVTTQSDITAESENEKDTTLNSIDPFEEHTYETEKTDSPPETEVPAETIEYTSLSDINLADYITKDDIKNKTSYDIDVKKIVSEPLGLTIDTEKPQILIIHTHGSEAYTPDGDDTYVESDPMRTEDLSQNVVRVGDELTEAFESYGIQVIHDRELYDYPSYNGSYTRSYDAIQDYLDEYPDIKMVIDLHRDAVDTGGDNPYVTKTEIDGKSCAQVLMLIGTDYSGLEHPNWKENLRLGLYLQAALEYEYPGLARPLKISEYRYNQQATTGSMILEVGYCTNTLEEAINAVTYFADTASDVLLTFGTEE